MIPKQKFDFLKKKFTAAPVAYVSSQARDWIRAAGAAASNPLTHYAGWGIEPAPPQQPEPLQSDS